MSRDQDVRSRARAFLAQANAEPLPCPPGGHATREYLDFHRCETCGLIEWKEDPEPCATPKDPRQQEYLMQAAFSTFDDTPHPERPPERVYTEAELLGNAVREIRRRIHDVGVDLRKTVYTHEDQENLIVNSVLRDDLEAKLAAMLKPKEDATQ